jgi:DNA-binding FadR family transcriptional regulator
MEIRILIEPSVIELAATRATAGDLAEMEEYLRRGEAAETVAEFEHWDGKLHVKILETARNQPLTDIYQAINGARRQAEWGTLKERILTPERRRAAQDQHGRIVAALRQRDAVKARTEMRAHLIHVRDSLLGLW